MSENRFVKKVNSIYDYRWKCPNCTHLSYNKNHKSRWNPDCKSENLIPFGNFKNLPNNKTKYGKKNIDRAIESNKKNDFLIELSKLL